MRESGAKTPAKWCSNRVQMGLGWRFLQSSCFLLYAHRDSLASNILPSIYLYVYYLTYFLRTSQGVRSAWASAFLRTKNESSVKSCLLPMVADRTFFTP